MQKSTKVDICRPCGHNCTESDTCDNWKCAIGCADSKFNQRVFDPNSENFNGSEKVYPRKTDDERQNTKNNLIGNEIRKIQDISLRREIAKNIDFNTCNPIWQKYSIDLAPANIDNKWIYYAVAIPATTINILVVGWQLYQILQKDIHARTYRDSTEMNKLEKILTTSDRAGKPKIPVWKSDSKFSSAFEVLRLLSSMFVSMLDSIFDAVYYIRLWTMPRMIHVRSYVKIMQGVFLYIGRFCTCVLQIKLSFSNIERLLDKPTSSWDCRRIGR